MPTIKNEEIENQRNIFKSYFGTYLKEWRQKQNMSISNLFYTANYLDENNYRKIENGQRMPTMILLLHLRRCNFDINTAFDYILEKSEIGQYDRDTTHSAR